MVTGCEYIYVGFFSFFFFSLCIFFKHKSNCWWNVFQLCKLRVSPGQDKVRTWFAHVHRKGHLEVCTVWYLHDMIIPFRYLIHIWFLLFFLQTYIYIRKDHNLSQMMDEYGLFVIPTMPLVDKIMADNPQFQQSFGELPWDRYLGNWYTPLARQAAWQQTSMQQVSLLHCLHRKPTSIIID